MVDWELEIQNRINIGLAFGWSYWGEDDEFSYSEMILYLGLISLHFKFETL